MEHHGHRGYFSEDKRQRHPIPILLRYPRESQFFTSVPVSLGVSGVPMLQTHSGYNASRNLREDIKRNLTCCPSRGLSGLQWSSHSFTHSTLFFFLIILYLFILFLTALGLHCCSSFSLVAESRGYPLVTVLGLLTAVASLVAERRL